MEHEINCEEIPFDDDDDNDNSDSLEEEEEKQKKKPVTQNSIIWDAFITFAFVFILLLIKELLL